MQRYYEKQFEGQKYLPFSGKFALVEDGSGVKVVTRGSYRDKRRAKNRIARKQRKVNRGKR